jgi:hypothetical protein
MIKEEMRRTDPVREKDKATTLASLALKTGLWRNLPEERSPYDNSVPRTSRQWKDAMGALPGRVHELYKEYVGGDFPRARLLAPIAESNHDTFMDDATDPEVIELDMPAPEWVTQRAPARLLYAPPSEAPRFARLPPSTTKKPSKRPVGIKKSQKKKKRAERSVPMKRLFQRRVVEVPYRVPTGLLNRELVREAASVPLPGGDNVLDFLDPEENGIPVFEGNVREPIAVIPSQSTLSSGPSFHDPDSSYVASTQESGGSASMLESSVNSRDSSYIPSLRGDVESVIADRTRSKRSYSPTPSQDSTINRVVYSVEGEGMDLFPTRTSELQHRDVRVRGVGFEDDDMSVMTA